jgi:putative transposase
MPRNLKRYQQARESHFITFSCFHRRPLLHQARARDLFLRVLKETRHKFAFVVIGYVVMPEHVHLLLSEPERRSLALALQMLKQNSSRRLRRRRKARATQGELFPLLAFTAHFWQKRYYDFDVRTEKKRIEKLRYIYRNPVTRGLVARPEEWRWSSYRAYAFAEASVIKLNEWAEDQPGGAGMISSHPSHRTLRMGHPAGFDFGLSLGGFKCTTQIGNSWTF